MLELKHSITALLLKELLANGGMYEEQLIKLLSPDNPNLFGIAVDRMIAVKYIIKIKGVSQTAYAVTPNGKQAYEEYLDEIDIEL